ncbi:MAG: cytochrome c-type biogenesis protein CcmH [Proteobacteria bacterium]|nr:cytochrome c-type biogenesis protein CcmH [Pseudomonadota bacterium]
MCKSRIILRLLLSTTALLSFYLSPASALTVNEVARELACPCECPLVLEDCNMSCGLDWKNQIGEKISKGKGKQEIIDDFLSKYGDACRITPVQRVQGKFFQYTRAFGTMEWVVFWAVIVLWAGAVFLGIYLLVRKVLKKKTSEQESG